MPQSTLQPIEVTVAVLRESGSKLLFEQAQLAVPRPDEVRVRVVATGVCHTDMVVRDQLFPTPLPIVLGHEGAGVVEAVGAAVTTIAPGDHVVMTYMSCGLCLPCETGHPAHCSHISAAPARTAAHRPAVVAPVHRYMTTFSASRPFRPMPSPMSATW
jgi:Zn-dependent alcohol dehydrogenase